MGKNYRNIRDNIALARTNIRYDPGETVLSLAQRALANLICREFEKENE